MPRHNSSTPKCSAWSHRRNSCARKASASDCNPSIRFEASLFLSVHGAVCAPDRSPHARAHVSPGRWGAGGEWKLSFFAVVGLTIVACVSADWVWFEAGRRGGDKVLHFMHGFTRDPDFHDHRAKRSWSAMGCRFCWSPSSSPDWMRSRRRWREHRVLGEFDS